MTGFLIRWFVTTMAILLASYLLPGVGAEGFGPAAMAALVLGLLNAFIRPIVLLLTLPINLLTLGLFTFVVNGGLLLVVGAVVQGFVVKGFGWAVLAALFISLVSFLLTVMIHREGRVRVIRVDR